MRDTGADMHDKYKETSAWRLSGECSGVLKIGELSAAQHDSGAWLAAAMNRMCSAVR
jgi:hypothetical protein